MIATRTPLNSIGMNSLADRHARIDDDTRDDKGSARKKPRTSMRALSESNSSTREQEIGAESAAVKRSKRKKDYDQESDGFVFTKNKRAKPTKEPAIRPTLENGSHTTEQQEPVAVMPTPESADIGASKTTKKLRRQLPTTPERDSSTTVRRKTEARAVSQAIESAHVRRIGNSGSALSEHVPGERVPNERISNERIQSPRPITVEKKRRKQDNISNVEEEHTARILLPASDTPIIRRNKAMRQSVAHSERRRSSSGMRGRRASSMIDEGRWNGKTITSTLYPPLT